MSRRRSPLRTALRSLPLLALLACSALGPDGSRGAEEVRLSVDEPTAASAGEAAPGMRPADPAARLCDDGKTYVVSTDPKLPRVRYLDGQVSLSDSCAVKLGNRLSRKVPPAYVNGQPIGFC